MRKLLMRGGMSPLDTMTPEMVIQNNSILANAGNLLYQHGLYRTLLTEDTVIDMDYYNITKDNYTDEEIDRINAEYDAYVCPLANAFRDTLISGLIRLAKLFDRLTIPCYVIGICLHAPYEPDIATPRRFDDAARQFVTAALKKSAMIGVRGEITGDYLKFLGFKEGEDYVPIGCPSMFTWGNTLPEPRHLVLSKNSKISFNYHFRSPNNVIQFVFREIEEYSNAYVVAQNLEELALLYYGKPLPKGYRQYHKSELPPYHGSHFLLQENRYRVFINTPTWFDFLRNMDLSIGGRFHGNVAAVLAGCPALFIPTDSRMRELVSYHRLPSIPYNEINDKTCIEELIEKIDLCSQLSAHPANFTRFTDFLNTNQLDHIYKEDTERCSAPLEAKIETVSYQIPKSILHCDSLEMSCRIDQVHKKAKTFNREILEAYLNEMAGSLFSGFQVILFYGAGIRGRSCLKLFKALNIPVNGFVISDDQPVLASLDGLPVYKYSKLPFCKETTLIIQTAGSAEVEQKLRDSEFHWIKFPDSFWKTIKD